MTPCPSHIPDGNGLVDPSEFLLFLTGFEAPQPRATRSAPVSDSFISQANPLPLRLPVYSILGPEGRYTVLGYPVLPWSPPIGRPGHPIIHPVAIARPVSSRGWDSPVTPTDQNNPKRSQTAQPWGFWDMQAVNPAQVNLEMHVQAVGQGYFWLETHY